MVDVKRVRRASPLRCAAVTLVLLSLLAVPQPAPTYAASPDAIGQADFALVSVAIPANSIGNATLSGTLGANKLVGVVVAPGGTVSLNTQTPVSLSGLATLVAPCEGWIRLTGTVVVSGVVTIAIQDGTAPSSTVFASGTAQLSSVDYYVGVGFAGTLVTVPIQGTASLQATLNNVSVSSGKTFAVVYNPGPATISGAGGVNVTGTGNSFLPMKCSSFLPQVTQISAAYSDDFSNPASGWPTWRDGNCKAEYKDGKFRITVKDDETRCMVPAYPVPPRASGTFSVKMQRRSSDEYPTFSGMWFGQLGGEAHQNRWEATIRSDPSTCDGKTRGVLRLSAIVNGRTALFEDKCTSSVDLDKDDTNVLRIERGGGRVKVYVNNQLVQDVADSWLAGDGYFGLVVISDSGVPVVVDFDDFQTQ